MEDSFSERYGYVAKVFQIEDISARTRNRLWDCVNNKLISFVGYHAFDEVDDWDEDGIKERNLDRSYVHLIYSSFFGYSIEDLPYYGKHFYSDCRKFFSQCPWYKCFDFIEQCIGYTFVVHDDQDGYREYIKTFEKELNGILEQERCMYRLSNGLVIPITNEAELIAISSAIQETMSIQTVNSHLIQAVKLFADRESPDYRNSIKESVSAVEGLLAMISGVKGATMGESLKKIKHKNTVDLHPALITSLTTLYGWASDEARHALKEESVLDGDDAKLTIITCCNFVSYLLVKATKLGIQLEVM